jgi:hypothetical protein
VKPWYVDWVGHSVTASLGFIFGHVAEVYVVGHRTSLASKFLALGVFVVAYFGSAAVDGVREARRKR